LLNEQHPYCEVTNPACSDTHCHGASGARVRPYADVHLYVALDQEVLDATEPLDKLLQIDYLGSERQWLLTRRGR
jgi:hypothetical protein